MNSFAVPQVVVSKCIEFDACRYNGDLIHDDTVASLKPFVEFTPVCPEVEIGLGTPRETIRLVGLKEQTSLIQPSTGLELTTKMDEFSHNFLNALGEIDGFILKSRSPSCGPRDVPVYINRERGAMKNGKAAGRFAQAVNESFSTKAIEEEGRLRNFTIREHFFTKLFTIAEFRVLKKTPSHKKLVSFHAKHKYLFMAYNQTKLKELGRIVANHQKLSLGEVFEQYEVKLAELFKRAARYTSNINVCQHIFGYFSNELNAAEKAYFLDLLSEYGERKLPLSSITTLLKSWVIRFENDYLGQQSFFEPYPKQLISISDSGKGRNYA